MSQIMGQQSCVALTRSLMYSLGIMHHLAEQQCCEKPDVVGDEKEPAMSRQI